MRSPKNSPYLATKLGDDIVMAMARHLLQNPAIPHGNLRIGFTPDEEIGRGVTKTFAGLASLVFLLLIISQFMSLFNYTNMPQMLTVAMAGLLEQMSIGPIPLLVGMILVIFLLDFIIPGSMPKWAIFAPVFVPIFVQLA